MEKYVKCISLTLGNINKLPDELNKIYKIINENTNEDWNLENIYGSVSKKRFIPATEEEYNIQKGIITKLNNNHEEALIKLLKQIENV